MKVFFIPVFRLMLLFVIAISCGCTHRQLRYDHVMQARSLTTIYEQQVLDNLAMFAKNPDSLPFFALPGTGFAQVGDRGLTGVGVLNIGRVAVGPVQVDRTNTQQWTLAPMSAPAKLERMQLLYQAAVNGGIKYTSSNKRLRASECELKGSYCGCHIQICSNSKNEFTRLVLAILDVALNDPEPPKEDPTVTVEDFVYDKETGKVDKVYRYTAKDKGTGNFEDGSREGETIAAPPVEPSSLNGERAVIEKLQEESELNLLRGTLFNAN